MFLSLEGEDRLCLLLSRAYLTEECPSQSSAIQTSTGTSTIQRHCWLGNRGTLHVLSYKPILADGRANEGEAFNPERISGHITTSHWAPLTLSWTQKTLSYISDMPSSMYIS